MNFNADYKPPFPYFGGKSAVADVVWRAFGNVTNYVEPFFGSGAVLFLRPGGAGPIETVNDADGFVANFWRALKADPDAVTEHADWPVNECDLHARHLWLVGHRAGLTDRLSGDPEWFDAKAAGWWCWGLCCWIGSGWCSGNGPWVVGPDGAIALRDDGDAGQGVNRKRHESLREYLGGFANRLANVRVCCGDWARVCGTTPTVKQGLTGVFLDPPYADTAGRSVDIYATDCLRVAHDVREWAIERGSDPLMRIALCGYEGEHQMPGDWRTHEWSTRGGYGSQGDGAGRANATRERIWFSPACVRESDHLFSEVQP